MACVNYTCPFSDGFECFYLKSQCLMPFIWKTLQNPSPNFPTELGFCLVPVEIGYVNLSIMCRYTVTSDAIDAFVNLKAHNALQLQLQLQQLQQVTQSTFIFTPLIIGGIVASGLCILLIVYCSIKHYK